MDVVGDGSKENYVVNRMRHEQQAMREERLVLSSRVHSYLGSPARGGPGT